jgi:hypothetical protein
VLRHCRMSSATCRPQAAPLAIDVLFSLALSSAIEAKLKVNPRTLRDRAMGKLPGTMRVSWRSDVRRTYFLRLSWICLDYRGWCGLGDVSGTRTSR